MFHGDICPYETGLSQGGKKRRKACRDTHRPSLFALLTRKTTRGSPASGRPSCATHGHSREILSFHAFTCGRYETRRNREPHDAETKGVLPQVRTLLA